MDHYLLGIISFTLFVLITISYTSSSTKIPSFRLMVLFTLIPYIMLLLVSYFNSYNLFFWSYSLIYSFLIILFYFIFYTLVKSISVRILIDLNKNINHSIGYKEVLENYILEDSFYRRVNILIANGMIITSNNYLRLTEKGERYIRPIIRIQKLLQIKLSG